VHGVLAVGRPVYGAAGRGQRQPGVEGGLVVEGPDAQVSRERDRLLADELGEDGPGHCDLGPPPVGRSVDDHLAPGTGGDVAVHRLGRALADADHLGVALRQPAVDGPGRSRAAGGGRERERRQGGELHLARHSGLLSVEFSWRGCLE
jgi:hypothetical protein